MRALTYAHLQHNKHSSTIISVKSIDVNVLTIFLAQHLGQFDAEKFHLVPRNDVIVEEVPVSCNLHIGKRQNLVAETGLPARNGNAS